MASLFSHMRANAQGIAGVQLFFSRDFLETTRKPKENESM
jgi:hypothetical protein